MYWTMRDGSINCPMSETIRIDDMRLFAKLAEHLSFTRASRELGLPKQTFSRRIAVLESALGTKLLHRTTRRLKLTDLGAAYAARCTEVIRLADEANRAVTADRQNPSGTLRLTADPTFGEAFLSDLVAEYARTWPAVRIEVVLTRRRVDLLDEGFDLAFRVGQADDPTLSKLALGPATIRYCATARYLDEYGEPERPRELQSHRCVVVSDRGPVRWPFRHKRQTEFIPVTGHITTTSFAMARTAVLSDLGITMFPAFACAADLETGRLCSVLDNFRVDVGSVWLLHLSRRFLPARVEAFVELAKARLGQDPPWIA